MACSPLRASVCRMASLASAVESSQSRHAHTWPPVTKSRVHWRAEAAKRSPGGQRPAQVLSRDAQQPLPGHLQDGSPQAPKRCLPRTLGSPHRRPQQSQLGIETVGSDLNKRNAQRAPVMTGKCCSRHWGARHTAACRADMLHRGEL